MAKVKFLTKGTGDRNTIYIRFYHGRSIDYTVSTDTSIKASHWSNSKNWIQPKADFKDKLIIQASLRDLEKLIFESFDKRIHERTDINREWLEGIVNQWQGSPVEGSNDALINLMREYKEHLPHRVRNGKIGVSQGTIRNFNTSLKRLEKFEKAQKKQFRVIDVDLNFHAKYLKFASNELRLAPNSIGKDIKQIKTVCLYSMEKGIEINEQIRSKNFSAPSEKTLFTTLNEVELEKIKGFEGSNYLENARDWLIIGCWTGCRVGDLMELTNENINIHTTGAKVIQYTQRKTGKLVNVPMHPDVQNIVERLGGFPRPISAVKFNDYIKTVCKKAGLTYEIHGTRQNPESHMRETGMFEKWQLIKSHTCRRSFATNHYNKLPNKMIMMVTGHATEKMLLAYIGETQVEHVDDFMNLWSSEKRDNKLVIAAI